MLQYCKTSQTGWHKSSLDRLGYYAQGIIRWNEIIQKCQAPTGAGPRFMMTMTIKD